MEQTNHCVEFHILDCGITKRTKDILVQHTSSYPQSIILFHIIPTKDIRDFPTPAHFSSAMYARFYIAELVPHIEKALYIDVDTCIFGDIAEIFSYDLGQYGLGAVSGDVDNIYVPQELWIHNHKKELELQEDEYYFCSGLLLIDCNYWREHNIKEQCFNLMMSSSYNLTHPDQDVLNLLFRKKYKALPPYSQYFASEIEERYYLYIQEHMEKSHCVIIHYTSGRKPWNTPEEEIPLSNLWWKYAKITPFYHNIMLEILNSRTKNLLTLSKYIYRKTFYTHLISYLKYKFARGEKRIRYKKEYLALKNV